MKGMPAPTQPDAMTVFDRRLHRLRRERAAPGLSAHAFLIDEVADRLLDRLGDVRRTFPVVLDLGCHTGQVADRIGRRPDVDRVIRCDLSAGMARRAGPLAFVADEEFLPVAGGSLDLVTSCLGLHWVNDLPGALIQVREALRPDGLFLGAMLGGDTLFELRQALFQAETETTGGVSPRISPMADLRDAAGLLQRAGFALPVADLDTITVSYGDPFALMRDLRGMGQTNAVHARLRRPTRRETLLRAAALLQETFAGPDGRIGITFQVVWLMAWAPHAAQPKPLPRGSARMRLADALDDDPPQGA